MYQKSLKNLLLTHQLSCLIPQASLIAADKSVTMEITGNGELILNEDGVLSTGSGGNYALAAAKALMENTNLEAEVIAKQSMKIAADMCVFTNHNFTTEILTYNPHQQTESKEDNVIYTKSNPQVIPDETPK